MTFSNKAIKYFLSLSRPPNFQANIGIINPYECKDVRFSVEKFYKKFYNDENERLFIIGINPGRFGGGLTGIAFTDPVALKEHCGIENNLGNRKELSSKFIYRVAEIFGGVNKFFSRVFLTALYPFAIIKDGKNYNYYEDKSLTDKLNAAIIKTIESQIEFGAKRGFAILLGKRNAEYFYPINEKHKFFKQIFVLEHPRYIMQYKLKQIDRYIKKYIDNINLH